MFHPEMISFSETKDKVATAVCDLCRGIMSRVESAVSRLQGESGFLDIQE